MKESTLRVSTAMRAASSLVFALACLCSVWAAAQSNSPSAGPLTLHVYENLMQFPVVVLSNVHVALAPIAAERFAVSLDSGPQFRPTHVRREGDDPISLSIVADLRLGQAGLSQSLGNVVAKLVHGPLGARDRVSVYIVDGCRVIRVLYDAASAAPEIEARVNAAGKDHRRTLHKYTASTECGEKAALWDGLANVVDRAARLPGRRVILTLSDDPDGESQLNWLQIKNQATRAGVAIFGLETASIPSFRFDAPRNLREDNFQSLCELSGGLLFTSTEKTLDRRLSEFVVLLRDRYIVEFPRPDTLLAGDYNIEISIAKLSAFIRPAGMSVPISDSKLLNGPNRLKSDPSLSPPVGSRKAMPLPH